MNGGNAMWLTVVLAATGISEAGADILYDALYTDVHAGAVSTRATASMGGVNVWGGSYDMQSADDFSLVQGSTITSVTVDLAVDYDLGAATLPGSILVEFFADIGGVPDAAAAWSTTSTSYTSFELTDSWFSGSEGGIHRVGIDLSHEGISLEAGTWWVAVTSISDDNWYRHMAARSSLHQTGGLTQARDGGLAHGNGTLPGVGSWDWIPYQPSGRGDLALRIEGIVPSPGSLGVAAALGVAWGSRRRRSRNIGTSA